MLRQCFTTRHRSEGFSILLLTFVTLSSVVSVRTPNAATLLSHGTERRLWCCVVMLNRRRRKRGNRASNLSSNSKSVSRDPDLYIFPWLNIGLQGRVTGHSLSNTGQVRRWTERCEANTRNTRPPRKKKKDSDRVLEMVNHSVGCMDEFVIEALVKRVIPGCHLRTPTHKMPTFCAFNQRRRILSGLPEG